MAIKTKHIIIEIMCVILNNPTGVYVPGRENIFLFYQKGDKITTILISFLIFVKAIIYVYCSIF